RDPAPAATRRRPRSRRLLTLPPQSSYSRSDDVLGHDLCVLADSVEDRRLEFAQEVHSYKVKAWHVRAPVHLDRKAHAVEDRESYPAVLGSVAARPDERTNGVPRDVCRSSCLVTSFAWCS